MSFYRHSHTKKECTLQVCTPLSSWSVSIPGELLSSRAHLRFDKDNANISTIFCIFNLSNLREAYKFKFANFLKKVEVDHERYITYCKGRFLRFRVERPNQAHKSKCKAFPFYVEYSFTFSTFKFRFKSMSF